MKTCLGFTKDIRLCKIPTGGKWYCHKHRAQPRYFLAIVILGILTSYVAGLIPNPLRSLKQTTSQTYSHIGPTEYHLLFLLAKFQKDNGIESVALTAHGISNPNLTHAQSNQPYFDFRTELFGPPGPVSDDRPIFAIVLQKIPSIYLRHFKTNDGSFWVSVTPEGYEYLSENGV